MGAGWLLGVAFALWLVPALLLCSSSRSMKRSHSEDGDGQISEEIAAFLAMTGGVRHRELAKRSHWEVALSWVSEEVVALRLQ